MITNSKWCLAMVWENNQNKLGEVKSILEKFLFRYSKVLFISSPP